MPWYVEACLGVPATAAYLWLVFATSRQSKRFGVYTPFVTLAVVFGVPAVGFFLAPWATAVAAGLGGGSLAVLMAAYARSGR